MAAVLMVCDPDESKFSLLDRASKMAQLHSATLHVLDQIYVQDLAALGEARAETLQAQIISQRKEEIQAAVARQGLDVGAVVVDVVWSKDLTAAVLEKCKELDPVLVVKRVTTRNKEVFHTPTDWHLIQHCPAPLLLSPLKAFKKKPRVMVALDLATKVKSKAQLNHRLIAAAKRIADSTGAELHIACGVSVSPILAELDMIDVGHEKRKLKAQVKPLLEEFQAEYGVKPEHVHFKAGKSSKVLNSVAQKLKADLVVMGARGRKGVKGRLLGNTAEQMLQHLYTDLLLIRP